MFLSGSSESLSAFSITMSAVRGLRKLINANYYYKLHRLQQSLLQKCWSDPTFLGISLVRFWCKRLKTHRSLKKTYTTVRKDNSNSLTVSTDWITHAVTTIKTFLSRQLNTQYHVWHLSFQLWWIWSSLVDTYRRFRSSCYVVRPKSFRPDQLFKVTQIKQLCYFST